jgi:hypothetical protein
MIIVPKNRILWQLAAANRKYQNIIENGNFSDGTTGWSAIFSTHSASNNELTNTAQGTAASYGFSRYDTSTACTNKKVYIHCKATALNASCSEISITVAGTTSGISKKSQTTPTQDTEYTLSKVVDISSFGGNIRVDLGHVYTDKPTAVDKQAKFAEIIVVDLTAIFGAGSEPELAWCDANIPDNIIW